MSVLAFQRATNSGRVSGIRTCGAGEDSFSQRRGALTSAQRDAGWAQGGFAGIARPCSGFAGAPERHSARWWGALHPGVLFAQTICDRWKMADFGDTKVPRHNGLADRIARDLTPISPSRPLRLFTAPHSHLVTRDERDEMIRTKRAALYSANPRESMRAHLSIS